MIHAGVSRLCALLLPLAVSALSAPAAAEYLLGVGDVLEFSAASVPDLRQRTRVDDQGEIAIPLLGQVKAAGRPLSDVRAEVERVLPTRSLRRKTGDGLDVTIIDREEISLVVAEYRPVYLMGDVARPGEIVYRPRMSVRQAVALAGGYDLIGFRNDANPIVQMADLRAEYEKLWTEHAQLRALAWRADAERAGRPELPAPPAGMRDGPVAPSVLAGIEAFERDRFASNHARFNRERDSLQSRLQQSESQVRLVTEQLENSGLGVKLAVAELERARGLQEKGIMPITRVTEERRLSLATQNQQLMATERLEQIARDREELRLKLETLRVDRVTDLTREIQDAEVRLAAIRISLRATDQKLSYVGASKSQLTRGRGAPPELIIFRRIGPARERLVATEDSDLAPGDTLEIALSRPAPEAALLDAAAAR